MEMEMEVQVQVQIKMEVVIFWAPKASIEVISGAPKVGLEFRFASKRLFATDFEVLEVSGAPVGDQGR